MTEPFAPAGRHAAFRASEVIAATRRRVQPPQPLIPPALMPRQERPSLTDADRREIGEAIQSGALCRCCAGIHVGGELACPRLAVFDLDGDGKLKSGAYWQDGAYDTSRIIFAEEASPPDPDVPLEAGSDDPSH